MKTYFKDIYLPVKNNITGNLYRESHSEKSELITSIQVNYDPLKPIGKWVINTVFQYKNQAKRLWYGKTRKEIKALVNDINDFKFDPYLFLNQ